MARPLRERIKAIPIGVRLAVMMVALFVVALTIMAIASSVLQEGHAMQAVEAEARRLAGSLESSLRLEMLRGTRGVGAAVEQVSRRTGGVSISVMNHDGRRQYDTEPAQVGTRVTIGDPACSACHRGGAVSEVEMLDEALVRVDASREHTMAIVPIYNAPQCSTADCHAHDAGERVLGVLALDVPYGHVAEGLRSFRARVVLLGSALALFLFVAVILLLRRWVTRPVAALVEGTRTVAEGDLSHAIPEAPAELGELADSFNAMQDRLKVSQQQLVAQETHASMGKLAAGVAHEINNPLTGILSFAEELRDDAGENHPLRADCDVIIKEALRCREIVKNLLDFGRPQTPQMRQLQLAEVLQRPLRLVRKLPDFHGVELVTDLPPDLPTVQGDPATLQQVFLNLMVNASHAMPEGGRLTITGRVDAERVCLAFTDTGVGIEPENLQKIFEPYYSTKGDQGSGIGLSVCWSIIEQHGGRIEARSKVGEGTTFEVRLPRILSKA